MQGEDEVKDEGKEYEAVTRYRLRQRPFFPAQFGSGSEIVTQRTDFFQSVSRTAPGPEPVPFPFPAQITAAAGARSQRREANSCASFSTLRRPSLKSSAHGGTSVIHRTPIIISQESTPSQKREGMKPVLPLFATLPLLNLHRFDPYAWLAHRVTD